MNGIELMASRANGTVLAMDELGHITGKELQRIIYGLASGIGRQRMRPDGTMRLSHTWATFVVLSSERSLEEKITGDGEVWSGGMAARIPDVDVTGINRDIDLATMEKIRSVDQHFGHAGPAFIQAMVKEGAHQQAEEIRFGIYENATAIAGPGASSAVVRAALPFAILYTAGLMAQAFELLPASLDVSKVIRWAWGRFQSSTDAVALDPDGQIVNNLHSWIAQGWGSSIHPVNLDEMGRTPHRDAQGWYDDSAIYIDAKRISEACGGALKESEIARSLSRQGLIAKTNITVAI